VWTAPLYGAWSPEAGAVRPTTMRAGTAGGGSTPARAGEQRNRFPACAAADTGVALVGREPCHSIGRRNNVADAVDCLAGVERRPINHCGVHAGLHHRVLQPECFQQVRPSPSAVAQAAASRRGVARRPRWRFSRAADPFLAGALRRTRDDTASAFARRQHPSRRSVAGSFEHGSVAG
jgi:hypothetical protein